MDLQSVPIHKAFHEGCSIGSRWQMPSMQMHRVQTYAVNASLRPTERQHVRDEIDAAMIFAGPDFVNVHHDGSYHFLIAMWRAKDAESAA